MFHEGLILGRLREAMTAVIAVQYASGVVGRLLAAGRGRGRGLAPRRGRGACQMHTLTRRIRRKSKGDNAAAAIWRLNSQPPCRGWDAYRRSGGPATWPANSDATASIRSLRDAKFSCPSAPTDSGPRTGPPIGTFEPTQTP